MLDNPLRIMAFMWLVTGCLLTGEALILAPMGYQMETVEGNPFKSRLLTAIDQDRINEATAHIIAGSNGTITLQPMEVYAVWLPPPAIWGIWHYSMAALMSIYVLVESLNSVFGGSRKR